MYHFIKHLKKIDLFGEPIQFCLKKESHHKSIFSGFLSIILIALFLSSSIPGFFDLVLRVNITSISFDISNVDPPYIDLSPSKFNWAFQFTGGDTMAKQLFKVEVAHKIYSRDSKGKVFKTVFIRETEPCTEGHFNPRLLPGFQAIVSNISKLWCPKLNDSYYVEGKFTSRNFSFFSLKVSKCVNTTNVTCASAEEIEKVFQDNGNKVYFNLYTLNNILNLNDLDHTISEFLEDRMFSLIERKFYKEKNFYMIGSKLRTDSSIYSTDYDKKIETFIFDNDYDEAILDNTENLNKNNTQYLTIFIRSNFLSKEHQRTVKKYDEYFGYIGGVWSVLVLFFGLIARGYNRRKLLIKISNALYSFIPEKERETSYSVTPISSRKTSALSLHPVQARKKMNFSKPDYYSFHDKIKKYLLFIEGTPLISSLKTLLPSFCFSMEKQRHHKLQKLFYKKATLASLKDMDVIHLLQKVKEVDRLKEVLLSKEEKICFDFASKLAIHEKDDKSVYYSKNTVDLFRKYHRLKRKPLLIEKIKDYDRLFKGYRKIFKNEEQSLAQIRLTEKLDKELLKIFKEEISKDVHLSLSSDDNDGNQNQDRGFSSSINSKKKMALGLK